MSSFEEILAFLVVAGVIAISLAAIITRKNSAIGQAIADRMRRRAELRDAARSHIAAIPEPRTPIDHGAAGPDTKTDQLAILEAQQTEIGELSSKIDFLQRLVEEQNNTKLPE
jgi:archaellum component FlaG (FlaF/FlaG flagellin family)